MFEGYLDGSLIECLKARADAALEDKAGLTPDEVAVTTFLSRRLGEALADPAHKPLRT